MQLGLLGFKPHGKPHCKWMVVCLAVFLALFLMCVVNPGTAAAKSEYGDPATELTIKLNDGNGNITTLATYTIEQLKQMPQVERSYSSVDSMPAPNFTAAQGVLLKDLLAKVNIDINTVEKFYFTATDNYRSSLTKQYLFDTPRYYFPKIYECWNEDNTLDNVTYTPGVEEGKTPVEPIVAIESHQARGFGALETTDRPRFDLMDGNTTFRLCFGQADASELINNRFVRWMNGIEIVRLPSAAPLSGSVVLTAPSADRTYKPGDKVTISGTTQYLTAVTVNVTGPDSRTVHTASDLDAKSGSFSTEFTLDADTPAGDYSIKISGMGLAGDHTASFQVIKTSGSIALTAPSADRTYQPGDKVTISGTAQNLTTVTVNVIAPSGQTVHTASELGAKNGSFSTEFTLGADAAVGDYTIKISGAGLAGSHTAAFKVTSQGDSIALTAPSAGRTYRPGDRVTISGTAQNLTTVTVNVIAPGGQTVHTASDLDVKSGSFSTEFMLGADAVDGDYNIKISGAGLAGGYTAVFKVARQGGSVMLTTLTAGQTYRPGAKVTIGGTAQNLAEVTVKVTGPDGQTVYTAYNLDAKSGSFTAEFTLGADAADGDYSVRISGEGLAHDYTMPFKVAESIPAQGFLDLDKHWAQKEINELAAKGVLKGVTETEFKPDDRITRAQFAAMLARVLNIEPQQETDLTFQDVPAGAWYHDDVGAAVQAGLVSGYSIDVFGPNDLITREQMTAMITRAMLMTQKLEKPDQEAVAVILQRFKDENAISTWAKAEVALSVKQGVVYGKQSDGFFPQDFATRAEGAAMISRFAASLQ